MDGKQRLAELVILSNRGRNISHSKEGELSEKEAGWGLS